jgi:hypothetical protein
MRRDAAQLISFQLDKLQASEVSPYFRDYCGDIVSGVLQKSGSPHQNIPRASAATSESQLKNSHQTTDLWIRSSAPAPFITPECFS